MSSRKLDKLIFRHAISVNSNESASLNKTIDLNEAQREVENIKSKIKNARRNVITSIHHSNEGFDINTKDFSNKYTKH